MPGPMKPPCCAAIPKAAAGIRWHRRDGFPTASLAEQAVTAGLRDGADLVVDTSELPLAALRRLIERHFGAEGERRRNTGWWSR